MKTITAITCAYNERYTIKNVTTTVLEYSFDKVIIAKEGHQIALTIFNNFDLITKRIKNSISKSVNI
ncbi:MAG: hypothetical protein KAT68_02180 [Bacteroidales bacterium]|nr:hypothetical protein [Bacteroidales bacterium]